MYSFKNELLSIVENCRDRRSEESRDDLAWILNLKFNPVRDSVLQFIADHDMASVHPSGIEAYVLTATKAEVTDLVTIVVWNHHLPPLVPKLSVERMGNRPVPQEAYGFLGLQEALRWMVYKDTVRGRTIRFCDHCRKVLSPTSVGSAMINVGLATTIDVPVDR